MGEADEVIIMRDSWKNDILRFPLRKIEGNVLNNGYNRAL